MASQGKKNDGYTYRIQLQDVRPSESLAAVLARRFDHSSESQWRERILAGEFRVDRHAIKNDLPARNGMQVEWNRPGWLEPETPLSFETLFEDEHLFAASKPSGLPTLPGGGFLENTLLHLVKASRGDFQPLHRLGRGTSGVVLFAKTRYAASRLTANWTDVRKTYLALAAGNAANPEYDIQQPIGPVPHPQLGTVHAACPQGKAARSVARRLKQSDETTLFEVELHTGRPHQIRIHLASIGHPLVGDPMYTAGGVLIENPGLASDLGYHLHAWELELLHPVTHQTLRIQAEPPVVLQQTEQQ